MSEFLHPVEGGEDSVTKKKILDKLVSFRNDWEEEIPEEIVKSGDRRLKARTRWFTNVMIYAKTWDFYPSSSAKKWMPLDLNTN